MDIRTRASSSPDEHGSLEPRQDEPSPTRPRANEPDPRDPCRVSGPPQIIINHGRHAIVASDLSTQIHGELHTSQLGTFSGGICGRILQTKKRLPLSTVQSELTNGGVRPHTREAARRSHRLRPQGLKEASFTQSRSHWEKPNTRLSERIGDPRLCTIGLPSITFLFFP